MFIFLLIFLVICFIFYILCSDRSRLNLKFNRVKKYKEVTYVLGTLNALDYIPTKREIEENIVIKTKKIKSKYTKEEMEYDLIYPEGLIPGEATRCLILLHGIRDKKEDWCEKAKLLENYLYLLKNNEIEKMVFIIPNSGFSGESWYTNFHHLKDFRYEEYFSKELLVKMQNKYKNAKFGIAGFSMGGYGAYKIGIKNLDKFEVIGSISGAVSLVRMILNKRVFRIFKYLYVPKFIFKKYDQQHFMRVFGSQGRSILKEDPYSILKRISTSKIKGKKFYASVGLEDKEPYLMLQQWLDVVGRLKKYGYEFKGYVYKNEVHTWEYVSKDLRNFLRYFYKNTM
ncbi:MAG: alpha/beta hydrolase [Fusobacteriaceae bacterium]